MSGGPGGLRRRGSVLLGAGGLVSAALAWVVMVVVARVADVGDYADFVVVWSVFFAAAGVFVGLQQQVVRALRPPTGGEQDPGTDGPGVLAACGRAGAAVVPLVLVAFLVALRPGLGEALVITVLVVPGTIVLALVAGVLGVLAAEARWARVAGLGIADQALRAVAVVVVYLLVPGPVGAVAAVHAGLLVNLAQLRACRDRRLSPLEGAVFARRAWAAMVTTGCANVLVVGLPFLLVVTGDTPDAATASLFAAIYLTRSPVLVPANALRPIVLRLFLDHRAHLVSWVLTRLAPAAAALLALGAAGGWLVGPWLLRAVFGAAYDLTGVTMAMLVAAAVLMLVLTLTGMVLVAVDEDTGATLGWLAAMAVTVGLLLLPTGVVERAVLAMLVGPAVGVGWHLAILGRSRPQASTSGPPHPREPDPAADDQTQ